MKQKDKIETRIRIGINGNYITIRDTRPLLNGIKELGQPVSINNRKFDRVRAKYPASIKYLMSMGNGYAGLTQADGDRVLAEIHRQLDQSVPGLAELQDAQNEWASYHDQLQDAIDRGVVVAPKKPTSDLNAIADQYPRAAMYLRAEAYCQASHNQKWAAGKKAKEIILSGGPLNDAEQTLDKWAKNLDLD